jgi:hypothetical protein
MSQLTKEPSGTSFPRTDPSGEVDMEQLEYNLSLTPDQRMRQYMDWMEFVAVARKAGQYFYGVEPRASEAAE